MASLKKNQLVVFVVVGAALLLGLFFLLFALVPQMKAKKNPYGGQAAESALSISAVGFAGLYELLSQAGGPKVNRPAFEDLDKARDGLMVALAEDVYILGTFLGLKAKAQKAQALRPGQKYVALVFSSKWAFKDHPSQEGWVAEQSLKSSQTLSDDANYVLSGHFEGPEEREENEKNEQKEQKEQKVEAIKTQFIRLAWPQEADFSSKWHLPAPSGQNQIQLLKLADKSDLESLVSTPKGDLLVRRQTDQLIVYLISDPDVANNLGLGQKNNAEFILKVIKNIYQQEGLSGDLSFIKMDMADFLKSSNPNPFFGPLLEYPFNIISILTVLTALLFFGALGKRFGGIGQVTLEMGFGKSKLIDNSAKLMARPNLLPYALEAYQKMTLSWAEKTFHLPRQSNIDSRRWLDKVAAAKGLKTSLSSIMAMGQRARNQKSDDDMMACALKLYKFRKELESGSSHLGPGGQ
ncbi:MAG: hypothetical protein LBE80_00355 [Deltaproteobacteria bacterium]|nr:hypothetical protein [Deltaproteobacteria bacterium]